MLGRIAPAGGEPDGSAPVPPPAAATVEPADEAPGPAGGAPAAPADAPVVRDESPAVTGGVPAATPLALRMVAARGLDLSAVRAADPDGGSARRMSTGRSPNAGAPPVTAARLPVRPASPPRGTARRGRVPGPTPEAGFPAAVEAPQHERPLTAMRRVTATRMQQAKRTVPHFYLRTECRVDAALRLLAAAKRQFPDAPPTLTDLVVRAAASALRAVPEANSAWADGAVRVYERVDVAVAVATAQGLVAPVVCGADGKDLGAIARETRALAARAREGRLAPAEYAGGTFTVSNLGMYGWRASTPSSIRPRAASSGGGRDPASGGGGRPRRHRQRDGVHALRRPPGHRRRGGGRAAERHQVPPGAVRPDAARGRGPAGGDRADRRDPPSPRPAEVHARPRRPAARRVPRARHPLVPVRAGHGVDAHRHLGPPPRRRGPAAGGQPRRPPGAAHRGRAAVDLRGRDSPPGRVVPAAGPHRLPASPGGAGSGPTCGGGSSS